MTAHPANTLLVALPATPRGRVLSRRHLLLAAVSSAAVAACGGGGGVIGDMPLIEHFGADRERYFVGDRARLTARFRGGPATIEPGLGAVTNGAAIDTPPLDVNTRFDLVVAGPGTVPLVRSLTLPVAYRDRYRPLAAGFVGSGHGSAALPDGGVLLIGGSRGGAIFSDAVDRFDPATGTLTRIGTMQAGRWQPEALTLPDGRVLVAGGISASTEWRHVELIDAAQGRVETRGMLSVPRQYAGAAVLADGRVLFTGGHAAGERNELGISASAEIWDAASGSFRRLSGRMAMPRMSHRATLLGDGRVLLTGGFSTMSDGETGYRFAEIFDPATETFTAIDSPVVRTIGNHAAVRMPAGGVLLLGGEDWDGARSSPRAAVWHFDERTQRFSAAPPLATPRTLAAVAGLRDGRVLLFGGQDTTPERYSEGAELYDAASGGRAIAALPGQRAFHSVTRLADGRVLVAGGEAWNGSYAAALVVYE